MTAITYNVLDPNAKGADLELQQGGLVLTYSANNTTTARHARGTIGRKTGIWSFEFVVYGDANVTTGCYVGLVKSTASLSGYVGSDANGWGFNLGDGKIYSNGAVIATISPVTPKKIVTVEANLSVSPPTATFYVNGSPIATINLPTGGQVFYPAATVSGTTAYQVFGFMNCGQRQMQFPVPTSKGWYSASTEYDPVYFCSQQDGGYVSAVADTPSDTVYLPRILNAQDFTITRKCSVWPWKGRTAGTSFSVLELDNWDGAYDYLLTADLRDTLVRIRVVPRGAALSASTVVATGVLDKVETNGEDRLTVTLRDTLTRMQKPVQRNLFLPYMDAGVANRPLPITLGACRNIPASAYLYDSPNRLFQLSDEAITNIARLRDKGAPLDPSANPPQYTPTNDLKGTQLATLPQGVLTADVSSEGQQVIVPGSVDVLGGIGQFVTWTAGVPNGWTLGGSATGGSGVGDLGTQAGITGHKFGIGSDKPMNPPGPGNPQGTWLKTNTAFLKAGRSYRVTLKILQTGGNQGYYTNSMEHGFVLMSAINTTVRTPADWITPYRQPIQVPFISANTYTFTYTVPTGSDRYLYVAYSASEGFSSGSGNGLASGIGAEVYVEELAGVTQVLPLTGIKFADYYQTIFETRGGLLPADWSLADAQALDTATGYKFGVHIKDPIMVLDAAMLPLESVCGTLFTDANGVIRLRRLVDPYYPGVVPVSVYNFDTSNVKYQISIKQDLAQGLTTSFGARRNYYVFQDSDFVSDYNTVPAALRTQFKRKSQFIQNSTRSLATTYQNAVNAPPVDTLLDEAEQAQTEGDRVCFSYSTQRTVGLPRFVSWTFFYTPEVAIPLLYFGDFVKLTYPRFGFNAGRFLVVADVELKPYTMQCNLTCWG